MKYLIIVVSYNDYTGQFSIEIKKIEDTVEKAEKFVTSYILRHDEMCIYYVKGKVHNQ